MAATAKSLVRRYALFPETRAETENRYKANVDKIVKIIKDGENSRDRIWRNTCEWLINRKILHVLSPTEEINERTGLRKYLGIDLPVRFESAAGAGQVSQDQVGGTIMLPMKGLKGLDLTAVGKLLIVDPIVDTPEKLRWILKHEVQHAVTHIAPEESAPEDAYEYEFVADWVAGAQGNESERPGSAREKEPYQLFDGKTISGFDNARQLAIFADLYRRHPDVREMWDEREFRRVVLNLKGPKGPNLINSVRIDNLYEALNRPRPDMRAAHRAMHDLKDEDKATIRSQEPAWRKLFNAHAEETAIIAAELFPR